MNKINIFELKSKSEQEAYEFFDKFVRKLPRNADRLSKKILEQIKANVIYKEFEGGHGVTELILKEARSWLENT